VNRHDVRAIFQVERFNVLILKLHLIFVTQVRRKLCHAKGREKRVLDSAVVRGSFLTERREG
jgi:hypothetical protein